MSMTKKDFEFVAEELRSQITKSESGSKTREALVTLARRLCDGFEYRYPRFDIDKFRRATWMEGGSISERHQSHGWPRL